MKYLCDTCILIDYLRGKEETKKRLDVSPAVSQKASHLIEQYAKSHGLLIPDALIAATALEYSTPLYTSNISDFRFIPGIMLYQP